MPIRYKITHDFSNSPLKLFIKSGSTVASDFMKFEAFSSSLIADEAVRTKIQEALSENINRGEGFKSFKATADDVLNRAGLSKLKPHQLQTIYRTNTSIAYAQGQMAQMQQTAEAFPYWQYLAVVDSRTRDNHRDLHHRIFKVDDVEFYPPIGFNCRCTARPLTALQAGQLQDHHTTTKQRKILKKNTNNTSFVGNKNDLFLKWSDQKFKKMNHQNLQQIQKGLSGEIYSSLLPPLINKGLGRYFQNLVKERKNNF